MFALHGTQRHERRAWPGFVAALCLVLVLCGGLRGQAQTSTQFTGLSLPRAESVANPAAGRVTAKTEEVLPTTTEPGSSLPPTDPNKSQFRVDRMPIVGGSELLTIFGRLDGMRTAGMASPEVPLISVVRDTLGDEKPDNDRLRYVWMLTFTRPTLFKRVMSGIPFFYQHVGNQTASSTRMPAPIIDLSNTKRQTWNNFFWFGMQNLFFDTYGIPLKAASRSYRQNAADYREAHIAEALSILSSYERLRQRARVEGELLARAPLSNGPENLTSPGSPVSDVRSPLSAETMFTPVEMREMRARLILSEKTFGGLFPPDLLADIVTKHSMDSTDIIGHNWELLRQRAEAEGFYFEPLKMPDGTPSHALLWVSKNDLSRQSDRRYDGRFLNISNPWKDRRLQDWKGYSQVRYFDANNRPVAVDTPAARPVEMIPLALYGLSHPKIPAVLIDFRDNLNPKRRELSRRFFRDLTKNVFSLSSFGNLPYFISHKTYDFITGKRGMDVNQPSRVRSYSELKLLLFFNESLTPELRDEIGHRLESVSLNPLTNDNQAEVLIARQQYDSLLDFARRPDGLAARIERDRRAEMVPLKHGSTTRFFFNLANVMTFGHYVHREDATPELSARLESARVLRYHTNFLLEVAKSSPQIEVTRDLNTVRRSLEIVDEHAIGANGSAARAAAMVFQRTRDREVRQLCLETLSRMNNKASRKELLSLFRAEPPQSDWRPAIADRLRRSIAADTRIKPAEAKAVLSQVERED